MKNYLMLLLCAFAFMGTAAIAPTYSVAEEVCEIDDGEGGSLPCI